MERGSLSTTFSDVSGLILRRMFYIERLSGRVSILSLNL